MPKKFDEDGLVQPQWVIGPNYAGKMILRGMFLHVSQSWFDSNQKIRDSLANYLLNRCGEVGAVKLPRGEEMYAKSGSKEVKFVTDLVEELKSIEKDPSSMTSADIATQVAETDRIVHRHVEQYKAQYHGKPTPLEDAIFKSTVIRENVNSRDIATHEEAKQWPARDKHSSTADMLSYMGEAEEQVKEPSKQQGLLATLKSFLIRKEKEPPTPLTEEERAVQYAAEKQAPGYKEDHGEYTPPPFQPAPSEEDDNGSGFSP